jgi:hypothetical protein
VACPECERRKSDELGLRDGKHWATNASHVPWKILAETSLFSSSIQKHALGVTTTGSPNQIIQKHGEFFTENN